MYMGVPLNVTKAADTNDCVWDVDYSLGEAISKAESGDTINIPVGTFTIGTRLDIDKDLTLVGSLSASTIIQAAESPEMANYGVLSIDSGNAVDISNLTSSMEDEDGQVVKVFLNRTAIRDRELRPVKYLPTIKVLNITGTKVSDAGLAYVKELTSLEHFYPDGTLISDEGIAGLKETLPKLLVLE